MKLFKRISAIALAIVIIAIPTLSLASCAKDDSDGVKTLYVYNWGEYISDGSEDSLDSNAAFEEWYYQTYGERVKVNYSTYSSTETTQAAQPSN